MANSDFYPDRSSPEIGYVMADHLIRYARGLLERGDREGAEEIFQEAAYIQVQALQHALEVVKPPPTS